MRRWLVPVLTFAAGLFFCGTGRRPSAASMSARPTQTVQQGLGVAIAPYFGTTIKQ